MFEHSKLAFAIAFKMGLGELLQTNAAAAAVAFLGTRLAAAGAAAGAAAAHAALCLCVLGGGLGVPFEGLQGKWES